MKKIITEISLLNKNWLQVNFHWCNFFLLLNLPVSVLTGSSFQVLFSPSGWILPIFLCSVAAENVLNLSHLYVYYHYIQYSISFKLVTRKISISALLFSMSLAKQIKLRFSGTFFRKFARAAFYLFTKTKFQVIFNFFSMLLTI